MASINAIDNRNDNDLTEHVINNTLILLINVLLTSQKSPRCTVIQPQEESLEVRTFMLSADLLLTTPIIEYERL